MIPIRHKTVILVTKERQLMSLAPARVLFPLKALKKAKDNLIVFTKQKLRGNSNPKKISLKSLTNLRFSEVEIFCLLSMQVILINK